MRSRLPPNPALMDSDDPCIGDVFRLTQSAETRTGAQVLLGWTANGRTVVVLGGGLDGRWALRLDDLGTAVSGDDGDELTRVLEDDEDTRALRVYRRLDPVYVAEQGEMTSRIPEKRGGIAVFRIAVDADEALPESFVQLIRGRQSQRYHSVRLRLVDGSVRSLEQADLAPQQADLIVVRYRSWSEMTDVERSLYARYVTWW